MSFADANSVDGGLLDNLLAMSHLDRSRLLIAMESAGFDAAIIALSSTATA